MNKYKSITDFLKDFSTREACLTYLVEQKWSNGYCCKKCGHTRSHKGRTWYYRKCAVCQYDESCTSGTLFHKLKFPIEKAFLMMWLLSTTKKGMSCAELSRQFNVHQKTAWYFKRKVQQAMEMKEYEKLSYIVEADETMIGGKEKGKPGRSHGKKKVVEIALETGRKGQKKESFVKRAHAVQIVNSSGTELAEGLEKMVEKDSLLITDDWTGYSTGASGYVHWRIPSDNGENFVKLHWHIFNLKNWIRGIHHHISSKHIQAYLDEFHFRFNRRNYFGYAMVSLSKRMSNSSKTTYKEIIGT